MSTRSLVTVAGGLVGAYFGYPQLGLVLGGLVGAAVDPTTIQGPAINEVAVQTQAEGVPRIVTFGTVPCIGNVIQNGPLIKTTEYETQGKGGASVETPTAYRTFAIGICEGRAEALLRMWEDNKLVVDYRPGSLMIAESDLYMQNKFFHQGGEDALPDPFLEFIDPDTPAYRGTCYMTFVLEDQTDRGGSFKQYRFEVAKAVSPASIGDLTNTITVPAGFYWSPSIFKRADGKLGAGTTGGSVNISGGSYTLYEYADDLTISGTTIVPMVSPWTAYPPTVNSIYPRGYSEARMIAMDVTAGGGHGACLVAGGGALIGAIKPTGAASDFWWNLAGGTTANDAQRIWFTDDYVYVGTNLHNGTAHNNIGRWPLNSIGFGTAADKLLTGVCVTPGNPFHMHLGNDGKIRVINDANVLSVYTADLDLESSVTLPFSGFHGFGIDGDIAVFAFASGSIRLEVRKVSDWSLTKTILTPDAVQPGNTKVIFNSTSCYVQCGQKVMRLAYSSGSTAGIPTTVGAIVGAIHQRCGVPTIRYDHAELTDSVDGFSIAGGYTGADAINALRAIFMFDKSDHDGKLWYPKRGKAVAKTLTIDDLTDVPDMSRREQASDLPYKLNLGYQHAASGYAKVKATAPGTPSPDRRTTGEVSMDTAVIMDENKAAQAADRIYKVTIAEAGGTVELSVPLAVAADLADADCIGATLRGRTSRLRIEQSAFADWSVKLTLRADRQSAYTSAVTGIPIPAPTLPPSTIVGDTVLVVADIGARQDSEDDLHYLVAASGAMPAWHGATLQRSLDAGASFSTVTSFDRAARIGTLIDAIPAASEHYTDTTNIVRVQLYRTTQTIDSLSDTAFLSERGAFLLEKADGTHEVLQYRDAFDEGAGIFRLSTLHRGRLNSGASAHLAGAKFVMLEDMVHVPASSGWIGQTLTHRGVSFDQLAELAPQQSKVYVGRSQIEWPAASLTLARSVANIVTGSWAPRHRFGTDDAPIASINFQGCRITIAGSSTVVLPDQAGASFSYDASALGASVTVSVQALNRITGAGPATSGVI